MWRETSYLIGLSYLLVSLCLALHIFGAPVISDEILKGSEAPSPLAGASTIMYPTGMRQEARRTQQNVTLIFVAGASICLAIFVVSYCIAYRTIIVRLEDTNRLHRSRMRRMAWEEQHPHGAEGDVEGHNGPDASLLSSLRTVQFGSGLMPSEMLKEEMMKPGSPLQEQNNVIVWVKECAVCLSEYEEGEEMKVLPVCGHCFHEACINMWLVSHTTCPICRLSLSLLKRPAAGAAAIAAPSTDIS